MNPKVKGVIADAFGVSGFALVVFGIYLFSAALACIAAGLGLLAGAVLLEKR